VPADDESPVGSIRCFFIQLRICGCAGVRQRMLRVCPSTGSLYCLRRTSARYLTSHMVDLTGGDYGSLAPPVRNFTRRRNLGVYKAINGLISLFSQPFCPGRHYEIDLSTLCFHMGLELKVNFCSVGARDPSTATSSSTALTRTTCTARDTLPNARHDNRPALGVAIGVGGRFRPVCLALAGSPLVSGHARQGRRIMRRPVRAVWACRQDPDLPGAAPERAAAERVACRSVVPVWPRYREDGLRP
jgi:hypothetical protein